MSPDAGPTEREASLACIYIEERVRRASGRRWLQGPRVPPLAPPPGGASPPVRLFAEHRLHRVPSAAAQALVAWARGERLVDLLRRVPTPREVLALQAKGRRCVSLLDDGAPTAPHEDSLAFALHDLCHLEKFAAPEHYEAQVGLSWLVSRAMERPGWSELEKGLDASWAADRDHVIADMNGSAVFLLLALKSKLKIAVRRRVAQERGRESAANGPGVWGAAALARRTPKCEPMDGDEQRAWHTAQEALLLLLEFEGAIGDAARALSDKGGAAEAMSALDEHLRATGASVLGRSSPGSRSP